MKLILGVANAATKLNNPNKAVEILEVIKPNFQTNIKSKDLLSLYNLAKSIVISDSSNFLFSTFHFQFPLLPLDGRRRFGGYVIAYPVNAFYLIYYIVRHFGHEIVRKMHPVGSHTIGGNHRS